MQKHLLLLLAFLFSSTGLLAQAGSDRLAEITKIALSEEEELGWNFGGGVGLDLAGMGIVNPRIGGGTSRIGLGGLGTLFANKKGESLFWNNQLSLQLSAQKLGRSALNQPDGFQKNLDILRLASTYGHKMGSDKWFYSVDMLAQTQLLRTYKSNYLRSLDSADIEVSSMFSPLLVQLSPGVTYKPNEHFSLQYSPVAVRWIYVADDALAALAIHGNTVERDANGNITDVSNSFLGLGSELVGRYTNKYFGDRLSVNSSIRLFSNYLETPGNIDVLFTNNFSLQLFKGLSLDLLGELFYDDDVNMYIDANDNDIYGDPGDRQAPATQLTGAFLLKYSKIF